MPEQTLSSTPPPKFYGEPNEIISSEDRNVNYEAEDQLVIASDASASVKIPFKDIRLSLRSLEKISDLEENWDNYGAPKISDSVIRKARSLLFEIIKKPDIFPTKRNSIQFEFENQEGDYLEFEILDSTITFFFEKNEEENEGIASGVNHINGLIETVINN